MFSLILLKILFPISIFIYLLISMVLLLILILEGAIAFLQAYVFITLSAIYLNDTLNLLDNH